MKIPHYILLGILMFGSSCSRSTTFHHQTPTGETIILKQTSTPGFLDPTIKRQHFVKWNSGKKERLPNVWFLHEGHFPRIVQTNDHVWIISERGLLVRKGSPKKSGGEWHQWEIRPDEKLFAFLFDYASDHHFSGVTTSSYTQSLRTGPLTVHATAIETNSTLHYAASPRAYFISQTDKQGVWLPQHTTTVNFTTGDILVEFKNPPESLPPRLVFSANEDELSWIFDAGKTKGRSNMRLQEDSRSGSP